MPSRSDSPGLKWRKTAKGRQPYWVAKQVVRDIKGYPDRTVRLLKDADDATLAELCRNETARLLSYLEGVNAGREPPPIYDGSILSLSHLYQKHPESPFHEVKHNTRNFYLDSLKIIEHDIGKRAVRNINIVDARRWYRLWKAKKTPASEFRTKRAHDAISMVRTILRFGFAVGHKDCGALLERFAMMRFGRSGARTQEMTYPQARDFIRKATEMGQSGAMPTERARYMALAVAAQFELMLRQMDIIGEWMPAALGVPNSMMIGSEMWVGGFRWEAIPGWKLRIKTSKSKYRTAVEFDLAASPLLFPLLNAVPHAERTGAIVKGEHGLPMREHSFRKWFRKIARAAGIPDEIWNMDSRAGAATEAEEALANLGGISDNLTHSDGRTTDRYIRRRTKRIAMVTQARVRSRETDGTS